MCLGYRGTEWHWEAAFARTECQNPAGPDSGKSPSQTKGAKNGPRENQFSGTVFSLFRFRL